MKYGAFLKRKPLTNGTTRSSATALSPASSLFKSVCLHDWWLIKPQEGEEGLAVAGFSSGEGLSVRAFKSAAISKRHNATTLETVDSFTILLVGFINKDQTLKNGFSSEVCSLFQFGFTYNWEEYTVKGSNKVLCSHDNRLAEDTMTDSVESHTTLEAGGGGTPSTISDKSTGIRRITRSMSRGKKDRPKTWGYISGN